MIDLPFFPRQASTIAPYVDLTLLVLILISGFFTLGVVVLIVYFGIRYRQGNPVDRSNPPTTSLKVELSWIFGLLFLGMGAYIWAAIIYFSMHRPPQNPLDVYVLGRQWMWQVQHPQGPREINSLHVPVGRPVRLIMTSQDVIHSYFVPAFRLKYDVIPGRYTDMFFEASETGEFPIYCAEFCGTGHSWMIGQIIVMEPRQYAEWLSGGQAEAAPIADAGQELFTQLGCSSCHVEGAGQIAPPLTGLFGQEVTLESGETVVADENYLRQSILDPQSQIVAGYEPIMPTYEGRVSEEQLIALIDYIRSLGGEGGTEGLPDEPGADGQERTNPTP